MRKRTNTDGFRRPGKYDDLSISHYVEKCSVRQVSMTISLAFLAPDLVRAAAGRRAASESSDFAMLRQKGAGSSKPLDPQ